MKSLGRSCIRKCIIRPWSLLQMMLNDRTRKRQRKQQNRTILPTICILLKSCFPQLWTFSSVFLNNYNCFPPKLSTCKLTDGSNLSSAFFIALNFWRLWRNLAYGSVLPLMSLLSFLLCSKSGFFPHPRYHVLWFLPLPSMIIFAKSRWFSGGIRITRGKTPPHAPCIGLAQLSHRSLNAEKVGALLTQLNTLHLMHILPHLVL